MDALPSATSILASTVGVVLLILLTPFVLQPAQSFRWLQRKHYQYEVTFSLYMLTPAEKFIFSALPSPEPGAGAGYRPGIFD
jgi:hypothetical protein